MTLKMYGLEKCTTCKKARDWLSSQEVACDFTDVKEKGLTAKKAAQWIRKLGGWEKAINRAGYTWRGLPASATKNLDDAKAAVLAAENPSLIHRPLIEHPDGTVTVGFSDKVKGRIA
jgi:Spx/MgsR family transcriptional regulator